jgi:hypothetical protein
MTLFECLRTYILASSPLAAKVPGGFFPGILPQNRTVLPLCVVRTVSGTSQPSTQDGGASPWSATRIEFTFWGTDYKTLEQAYILARRLFSPSSGVYLGGSTNGLYCPSEIMGPRDVYDAETKLIGIQLDVIGLLNGDTLS